jgi:predicted nucleotidyltransferase
MDNMISVLQTKADELAKLCRKHGVARLEVFGSAAGERFDANRSDVDFLVEFQRDVDLGPWLGRYFDLRDELSELMGRSVDLVMISALKNPYFIREVNRTRQLLYAA